MYEVLPRRLWIGNALEARDVTRIYDLEISAIVDLAREERPAQLPRDITYCRFPLLDGDGNDVNLLRMAVDVVRGLVAGQIPTLVACSAGMSRSPTIVGMAVCFGQQQSAIEWLEDLQQRKPLDISQAFLASVMDACQQ